MSRDAAGTRKPTAPYSPGFSDSEDAEEPAVTVDEEEVTLETLPGAMAQAAAGPRPQT
jgi:hypothetical protein